MFTSAHAPTIAWAPIFTPSRIVARDPIQTSSPMETPPLEIIPCATMGTSARAKACWPPAMMQDAGARRRCSPATRLLVEARMLCEPMPAPAPISIVPSLVRRMEKRETMVRSPSVMPPQFSPRASSVQ